MRRYGFLERYVRSKLNPLSTGLTRWWHGVGVRRVPERSAPARSARSGHPRGRGGFAQASPGHWTVPPGKRPGWEWLPEQGAWPLLRPMPWWVRIWYRTPFIDRYAYEWMWWHGGWAVLEPEDNPPQDDDGNAGDREPRTPRPVTGGGTAARSLGA